MSQAKLLTPPAAAGTQTPPPPPPRPWQFHLIELLCRLESRRQQLVGLRLGADADAILDQCEAMAQLTEDVATRVHFSEKLAAAQLEAVAKAGELFGACHEARRPAARSLIQSMLQALSSSEDSAQAAAVGVALNQTIEAINSYFALFTAHYPSSLAARGWVDAASAFLADFKQVSREMAAG